MLLLPAAVVAAAAAGNAAAVSAMLPPRLLLPVPLLRQLAAPVLLLLLPVLQLLLRCFVQLRTWLLLACCSGPWCSCSVSCPPAAGQACPTQSKLWPDKLTSYWLMLGD